MEQQVFEGTLEEIKKLTRTLTGNPKVRLIVLQENEKADVPITAGMFANELAGLTDEDFELAEWRPSESELNP